MIAKPRRKREPKPPLRLLFICTHNRCRSILAEALANQIGAELLTAASAGSDPADAVHPLTLQSLQRHGIPTLGLRSKSWDGLGEFAPDFVITVCDKAAAESCPLWLGTARKVHWGLSDPSSLSTDSANPTTPADIDAAFDTTIAILTTRLQHLREGLVIGMNKRKLEQLLKALADMPVGKA